MHPYAVIRLHLQNCGYTIIEKHTIPTFFLIQKEQHLFETSDNPVSLVSKRMLVLHIQEGILHSECDLNILFPKIESQFEEVSLDERRPTIKLPMDRIGTLPRSKIKRYST